MSQYFLEALKFRHACKSFDPSKKISEADFQSILEMGQLSPSSFGFEPWRFLIVQNQELREKLKEFSWGAQGQLPTASHFVIILARRKGMRYSSDYIKHMLALKNLPEDVQEMYLGFYEKLQKEDFKLLENDRALFDWASKQTYIALSNMMTGAATLGIDSCPMEGFDVQQTEAFLQEKLNIDLEEYGPSVMVAFGYRHQEPYPKSLLGSKMVRDAYGVTGGNLKIGAKILCQLALDSQHAQDSGKYFDNDRGIFAHPHPDALDKVKSTQVITAIEQIIEHIEK